MKKFLIFLAFAAMAAPAFASSSDERNYDAANVLWRKEASDGHNIAELRGFSHFSYAFGVVKSNTFTPSKGGAGDLDLNILEFGIWPASWAGITLGIDFDYRFFSSKSDSFILTGDTRKVNTIPFVGSFDKTYSTFNCYGIAFPVLLNLRAGQFTLAGGIETNILWGNTYSQTRTRYDKNESRMYDADINHFTFDIVASLSYYRLGVIAKYGLPGSPLLPEGSSNLGFWHIGIVLGF